MVVFCFEMVNVCVCVEADCASFLMRYVNYEIPAIKRQIGKCQQTQRVCIYNSIS